MGILPFASCSSRGGLTVRASYRSDHTMLGVLLMYSPELRSDKLHKALRNFLVGSHGGRVVFNVIILHCHNDCFEGLGLLFFKEICSPICSQPEGRKSPSQWQALRHSPGQGQPCFYFANLPAMWADGSEGFKTPLSLHFRGETLGFFSHCDLQEAWHIP